MPVNKLISDTTYKQNVIYISHEGSQLLFDFKPYWFQ